MQAITTVGLDIAKSVFQVHAIDAQGNVIVRRQLRRRGVLAFFQKLPPCLVGIEACASSHHWSRETSSLLEPAPSKQSLLQAKTLPRSVGFSAFTANP
jgi:transposase